MVSWSAGQLVVFVSHYTTCPSAKGETDIGGN